MNIGQAAAASGVSAKMIRYYESIGLVRSVTRTQAGYRVYDESDLHTLRFIRRARDLGFSIERLSLLLSLWRDRDRTSAEVKAVATAHIGELHAKIVEVEAMVRTLQHLADYCHGDHKPDCPILDDLADASLVGGAMGNEERAGRSERSSIQAERRAWPHAQIARPRSALAILFLACPVAAPRLALPWAPWDKRFRHGLGEYSADLGTANFWRASDAPQLKDMHRPAPIPACHRAAASQGLSEDVRPRPGDHR